MIRTDAIIIGGGQAGLAMSYSLQQRGIDHMVLERGRIGERWRSQRWDSLSLLTPNWMTRLPGHRYMGRDPHGFMRRADVIGILDGYRSAIDAPVIEETRVMRVSAGGEYYFVETSRGLFAAKTVVLATGHCDVAHIPDMAQSMPAGILSMGTTQYKNAENLPRGGVVVVGASASGLQIANEIATSGREVTICVGRHTRMPRSYRGHDIMHWLDIMGMLNEKWSDVASIAASRRQPSLQLVGTPDRAELNLGTLAAKGVRIVGRALDADRSGLRIATDLALNVERAEHKLTSVLNKIDAHIHLQNLGLSTPAPRPEPLGLSSDCKRIDFASEGISTVIWATGFRRDYSWLDLPVLNAAGEIIHHGGVTAMPGLYTLGLQFMRRRNSSFIDGVGADAGDIGDAVLCQLNASLRRAA